MNPSLDPADDFAELALRLLATAGLLVFLSFAIILGMATQRAAADDMPVCKGKDLLAELTQSQPKTVEKLESEAAETPNGKGTFWKIEKPGVAPSYLFGTMHMTDPRLIDLGPAAQKALDSASTVVIETTDILDQAKIMGILAAQPDLMMYTDGSTLASHLSADDAAELEAGLKAHNIPPASVARMKPWMLMSMLALPACEMARKAKGLPILDQNLALEAQKHGKQLVGLESGLEQLQAIASLPMDDHIRSLIDTLKLGDQLDDVIETMIVLYENQDIGMFWPLMREALGPDGGLGDGYEDFEQTIVLKRNKVMAERALPILAKGGAFIAIGALHLPGEEGVIELLRKDGYTLTRAD